MTRPGLRCAAVLMALALVTGHAAGIQLIAWMGMFADRVQSQPVADAFASTFDGRHPCCLCHVARELGDAGQATAGGRNAPKVPDQVLVKKPEMNRAEACGIVVAVAPGAPLVWPRDECGFLPHRDPEPATPPPRARIA
jgi:hypothetical protein